MDKDPITQDEMNFFDVCVSLGNERDIVLVKEKFRVASCYPFEQEKGRARNPSLF